MTEYPDLEKLKAANDALREAGKNSLFAALEKFCGEINGPEAVPPEPQEGAPPPPPPTLLVGKQDWQFELGNSLNKTVLVGERIGIRHKEKTLTIEIGWPREPEHGFLPDNGLARARVSLSQNVFIDALLLDEFTLHKERDSETAHWHLLHENSVGEKVEEEKLRSYVERVMAD